MTDQVLDVLKFVLLGLLYLFFARVLWAVWSEVRAPKRAAYPAQPMMAAAEAPTVNAERPAPPKERRERKPAKARSGSLAAARVVILEPKARRGQAFALNGEITVGRDESCTIVIPDDKFVSGMHARLFNMEGQPMVEDLGSTNGSFLNGNKLVGAKLLHPGDRIQIGYTVMEAQ